MKRKLTFLLILPLIALISSCQKEDNGGLDACATTAENIYHVPLEKALDELYLFLDETDAETRGGSRRVVSDTHLLGTSTQTKNGDTSDDPAIAYLVNFENEEGYAILSSDSRIEPILLVTDFGNLDPEEGTDDPGLILFLSMVEDYVTNSLLPDDGGMGGGVSGATPITGTIDTSYSDLHYSTSTPWTTVDSAGTIIDAYWEQGYFFNDFCYTPDGDEAPAGCGAIAVALVMYNYQKDATFNGVTYDWNLMKLVKDGNDWKYNSREIKEVGQFIRALGHKNNLNMDYGIDGSSSYVVDMPRTFSNFGYTSGGTVYDSYDREFALTKIKQGPIIVAGHTYKIAKKFLGITIYYNYEGGHGWVIDRYLTKQSTTTIRSKATNKIIQTVVNQCSYVHCNWGHGKSSVGYVANGIFNKKNATETKSEEEGYYQYNLKMLVDIKP